MFVLCLGFTICTMPHVIYGYTEQPKYHEDGDIIYVVSLGVYWLHYVFNVSFYLSQRESYWKAYKDYIQEKILPFVYKNHVEDHSKIAFDAKIQKLQFNHLKKDFVHSSTSLSHK